ncbi:hypothetical protein HYX16_05625, partial [Candidatus Woesearchaeota archaeon]|nr:hypothetical protein [Candidatus Woesearchaeota archaeon]
EDGSIVGGGAIVRELVKESKVYHKQDSTFLLERIAPSLTRLSVFSPSRNIANEVLEGILKEAEIKR